MSVAFRRESDDEHLEPSFELPIPPGPNLVTPRGLALIANRIAALEAVLASFADRPADDSAVKAARRDLRYWQTRQITAELAPFPDGETVQIGTRVTFTLNAQERSLAIVGHDEADPAEGLIGFAAPLARALIGAEVDEVIDFNGREGAITIVAISVVPDSQKA
ncbi:transcription elongation GreA/GreB family factor [Novosphingobium kunmingense]|uniref:Transcription elongation GreA/GreB family factor n=1 Tax=Novosphingobium kunmingense TaxID=1211806 RepID=A0A2N0I485_9SPHN|nr:GreA/GreB family elongation factor [Novosphingobium kunmingense]PKB26012.1 transcription elongation GreA/GreB family factor [Novosphingobium kunmingense]